MNDESAIAKPKSRLKKVLKGSLFVVVILLALYAVARLVYRYSGSNQWKLVYDEDGAKVYTLKQPGTDLELVKGVTRVHAKMSNIVAWLTDSETCKESKCRDAASFDSKEERLSYAYMRFDLPGPFKPRDVVLRIHIDQLPNTKEVWAYYVAAPGKEPLHDCCVRITQMSNTWRLTPVGKGEIEMEYIMYMDWGGFIPDPMSNIGRPKFMLQNLKLLQGFVSRERYKDKTFSYIREP
jgi:hypothetical protein